MINEYGLQNPNNIDSVLMSAKICFLLVLDGFYKCDFLASLQYTAWVLCINKGDDHKI